MMLVAACVCLLVGLLACLLPGRGGQDQIDGRSGWWFSARGRRDDRVAARSS